MFQCMACPFTSTPLSEPCEASGSKPGVLLQSQAGADLVGLTVKPFSYFLLCWGLRGLWALGTCSLCSCTEGCFQLLFCPPPHIPGCPSGPGCCSVPPLASCRSIGLCSRPSLPSRLWSWQLELTTASRKVLLELQRSWQTLVSSHGAHLGAPNLPLARFFHYPFSPPFFP